MTNYITYCARAKLRALVETMPGCIAIRLTAGTGGSFQIQHLFASYDKHDIMVCSNPRVVTDLHTFQQLESGSIDFSYPDADFIIKREPRVVPA